MTIKFKCVLEDGRIITGPIMGNGGMLGDAYAHLSASRQRAAAEDVLRAVIRRLKTTDVQHRIYEPVPNCCAVYLDYSAESDGDPVAANLLTTKFEPI